MVEGKNVRSHLMNHIWVGIEPSTHNQSSGHAWKSEPWEARYDVNDVYVLGLEPFQIISRLPSKSDLPCVLATKSLQHQVATQHNAAW